MARSLAPYPWQALDRLPRSALRAAAAARRRLIGNLDSKVIAQAAADLLEADVELVLRQIGERCRPPRGHEVNLAIGDANVTLGIEPALASTVLGRLLKRRPSLERQDAPLDAALAGALSAVVTELARRVTTEPVGLTTHAAAGLGECGALLEASAIIDGRAFAVEALVELPPAPTREPYQAPPLATLGSLEISVPLVVGQSLAQRSSLCELEPGAAWMPGEGLWIDRSGAGHGALAAPEAETGVTVDLAPDSGIVLRGKSIRLPLESEEAAAEMVEDSNTQRTIAEAVLETPIVVRVELGSVTLSARQWAELRSGDVLETGRRIAEPVELRVAGRVVARGELVDIEGELGVRIRELVDGSDR